jgi:putative membrane protein
MHLTGIIDAHEFRNRIIEARENLRAQMRGGGPATESKSDQHTELLTRIATRLDGTDA